MSTYKDNNSDYSDYGDEDAVFELRQDIKLDHNYSRRPSTCYFRRRGSRNKKNLSRHDTQKTGKGLLVQPLKAK